MKTQLTITRTDEQHVPSSSPNDTFTVMINPAELSHTQAVCYDSTETHGQAQQRYRFAGAGKDSIGFSVVLDSTGVVAQEVEAWGIPAQLRKLRQIVYDFNEKGHQPSPLRVLWGTFLFFGRLKSLSTTYTLFKPSGEPLRARLQFALVGSVRNDKSLEIAVGAKTGVRRVVKVRKGDTLPLLCADVYDDAGMFQMVALFNGLDQIEPLQEGVELSFPE